jgi:hypothetical protein
MTDRVDQFQLYQRRTLTDAKVQRNLLKSIAPYIASRDHH